MFYPVRFIWNWMLVIWSLLTGFAPLNARAVKTVETIHISGDNPPLFPTEKHLGRGLDGDIYGQFGRISSFKIGSFVLHDMPTAFPQAAIRSRQQGADGILFDNALRRFNLIFDYSREKLYIKPNGSFHEPSNLN